MKKSIGEVFNGPEAFDSQRGPQLNQLMINFYGFWGWICQALHLLVSHLTERGLELIAEPVTNEEYKLFKCHFPSDPAIFLHKVLMNRGYQRLVNEQILKDDAHVERNLKERLDYGEKDLSRHIDHYLSRLEEKRPIAFYLPTT